MSCLFYPHILATFPMYQVLGDIILKLYYNLSLIIIPILLAIGSFLFSSKYKYISCDKYLHLYILFLRVLRALTVSVTTLKLLL